MTMMCKSKALLMSILILSLLVGPVFLSSNVSYAAEGSLKNFKAKQTYTPGQFSDVNEDQWYGYNKQKDVAKAYEYGFMKGRGKGFAPNDGIKISEAITMACTVHSTYHGNNYNFGSGEPGAPWYQVYVDYAVANGIVKSDTFKNYDKQASRAEMAHIFANALPEKEFAPINVVEILPDVDSKTLYSDSIFMLYRAGILAGNDAYGTFAPTTPISRAQAAAIITRVALPDSRVSLKLKSAIALEKDVNFPLWTDVYTEGMYVDSVDELYNLMVIAGRNIVTEFHVKLSNEVYDAYMEEDSDRFHEIGFTFGSHNTFYHYQTLEFDYEIEYNLMHQIQGLIFNRKIAQNYVSAEAKKYDQQMLSILNSIIKPGMSDREKAKAAHDYMVINYKYDTSKDTEATMDKYSFKGLLNRKTAVCQGYAELYYLLTGYLDIESYYVTGFANNGRGEYESHAWNVIYVDGGYYHVDVTFDDPLPDQGNKVSYKYFIKTHDEMSKDHIW